MPASPGQQYDNTNRGAFFRNKKKERDSQPDYTGKIDVAGVEFFLSGWIKKSKAGESYLSLAVQAPQDRKPAPAPAPAAPQQAAAKPRVESPRDTDAGAPFTEDDIPF